MKTLFQTLFTAVLLLSIGQKAAAYSFTITGNVQDNGQPAFFYQVTAESQDGLYYEVGLTDFLGNYTIVFEIPTGETPAFTVSTYNLCTGDDYVENNVLAINGTTTINFDLCNPVTTCSPSYSYELDPDDPFTIQFIDNSVAQNPIYLWEFGDGATSTEQNPVHTYDSPGYKLVTLTVSNDTCTNTVVYSLLIGDPAACNCPHYYAPYCVELPDGTEVNFTNECEASCYGYEDATPCYDSTYCFTYFYFLPDTSSSNTILLQNISFGVVTDYLWNFGDGTTSTVANPVHTYSVDGGYLVTLAITTETGCTSFYYSTVFVGEGCDCPTDYSPVCIPTPIGINYVIQNSCIADCLGLTDYENCGGATYCNADFTFTLLDSAGLSYQFFNTSTGENLSYQWYFSDGGVGSTDANPVHTFSNEGNYLVSLEVYGSDGCYDYQTYHFTVGDGLADCQANFYYTNDWQDSLTVLFYNQSYSYFGSEITGWLWDFGDGNTSTAQNPTHTYAAGGVYTVNLMVDFADGCQSFTSFTVWPGLGWTFCECSGAYDPVCVEQPDGTYLTFSNACFAACNGYPNYVDCDEVDYCQASFYYVQDNVDELNVFFVDLSMGNNITNWLWNFGDGTTSTERNPAHTYSSIWEYQVTLTITTESGCMSTITYPVNLNGNAGLPPCYAAFWFGQDTSDLMTLNFMDYSAPGVDSWYWNFGDGQNSTEQNPTITYAEPGVYLASLTVSDAEANCTNTYSMLVWADTVAYYSSTCQALFIPQVSGLSVSYYDLSFPFGAESYAWDFGDGNTSTEQNPVHLYAQPGTYTTTLTTTNADGCTSTFR
ncbi:MAG: PKD domain-containing protein [Saprospiraceae bacterium]|nr:PKD domain-containing protein [Saprospiraceae bacterium]